MKKITLFLLISFLSGRNDPFELKMAPKTSPQSVRGEIAKPLENIELILPTTARILKEVKFVYQKLDGSITTETIQVDSDIDWHYPISISQVQDKEEFILRKPMNYKISDFEITIVGKTIHFNSPYKLKQVFVLPKPFRIVLDFNRAQKDIASQTLKFERRFFASVEIGTHQDFYRISLELDGQYGHDLEQDENGYMIILK